MAELTYDPTPADQPEFNEAEMEAIAIGEAAAQEEQAAYAGKFKDAEELEKAYIELQKKLGTRDEPETEQEELRETETSEEVEVTPAQELITSASAEYYEKGELTPETMERFKEMSSSELVETYLKMQQEQPQQQAEAARDLTDAETNTIYNQVGGEASYNNLMEWASENLPDQYTQAYDSVVDRGEPAAIQIALAGLKSQYDAANGVDGNLRTGRGAVEKADVFRSQAEVLEAMNDRRYDSDPAYRQDVFQKLERSNIEM